MKHIRTIAIATALSFALPAVAFAAEGDTAAETDSPRKRGKRGKRGERPHFPMKADKFMAHVEKRIARVKARVARRLEKSKLDDATKAKITAAVESATGKIHDAAKAAAADGTVTKAEAKKVRALAREMREKAREIRKRHRGKRKNKGDRKDRR